MLNWHVQMKVDVLPMCVDIALLFRKVDWCFLIDKKTVLSKEK